VAGIISNREVSFKGNASEFYFEEDDFDRLLNELEGIMLVCPPLEHAWGQRVVRFYDPDGHIIEVGENMTIVVRRFSESGMMVEEISVRMGVQKVYVLGCLSSNEASH
jgi:hypothetical protein